MPRLHRVLPGAALLVALGLVSCPNPITTDVTRQALDRDSPSVLIVSPANDAEYTQSVTVQGVATDPGGIVRLVEYRVTGALGVLLDGTLPGERIDSDGSFDFSFSAIDFSGPVVVTVTARDWNDNVGTATVSLRDPGSPISSLAVAPANKRIVVDWDPVPGATGYTLYWTANGTLPSEGYGESRLVTDGTSVDLTGLRNGALHTFLLRADVGVERGYWSNYVRAIPLSDHTLAPLVRGEYRRIELEWSTIDATDEFVVLRSTSPAGPYANLSGVIRGSAFTDTSVADGIWYYYRVRPAPDGSVTSTFNAAQTFHAPTVTGRVTSVQTGVPNHRVRIQDGFAYVAAGESGVLVMNLRNPADPRVVRTVATTNARDVAVEDGLLYVADGPGGLRVFSLAIPGMPTQVAQYLGDEETALTNAARVAIAAAHAFVIDGTDSVCAISVSNPNRPEFRDRYQEDPYAFHAIAAAPYKSGASVYVSMLGDGDNQGIVELSFSSLGLNRNEEPYVNASYLMRELVVHGDHLLVSGFYRFMVMSIGNTALHVLDRIGGLTEVAVSAMTPGATADLRVFEGSAVAVDGHRLHVYDITDPDTPRHSRSVDTPGNPTGVDTNGTYAYVASGMLLFQSVDLRAPTSPVIEAVSGDVVHAAVVRDGFAYTIAGWGDRRLHILDVALPSSPVPRGSLSLPNATSVHLSGRYAFVTDQLYGLRIVDVGDADEPHLVGSVQTVFGFGTVGRVSVYGDYAYIAASAGMRAIDIADPAAPIWIGSHNSDAGGIQDVTVRRRTGFVTDGSYGLPTSLKLLDVHNPESPVLIGKGPTGTGLYEIGQVDPGATHAFVVASVQSGIREIVSIDIRPSSGSFLQMHGSCRTAPSDNGMTTALAVRGDYVYALDEVEGLVIVDGRDPSALTNASRLTNLWLHAEPTIHTTRPVAIAVSGAHAYISDLVQGLVIVRLF